MSGVIRSIPGPTIRSCQERRDVSVMGVSFRVVLSFRFRVDGPFAAPLPERERVAIALRAGGQLRSEDRRVGQACVCTRSSRWSSYHYYKNSLLDCQTRSTSQT